ncbi:hypothetical protein Zmor_002250 [Zophobas morio]|uniref:Uncharacterized protein n=1 Tax=Zophobas morio TaxID=2755281 RepID=A0AA38MTC1_9CUCU|nr:hypothetical protein Zmor_002250 [Zophobas morio]
MYKIIPVQLDWLLSTFAGLDSTESSRSRRWARFKRILSLDMFWNRGFSGIPIATSASRFFFSERRPAAVTEDESPIIAVRTRTHRRRAGAAYGCLS